MTNTRTKTKQTATKTLTLTVRDVLLPASGTNPDDGHSVPDGRATVTWIKDEVHNGRSHGTKLFASREAANAYANAQWTKLQSWL
jgi:hypothetical protein